MSNTVPVRLKLAPVTFHESVVRAPERASNPNGRLFTHGLSVEELKEMTKLRLQHQQGGRSSPKTGISGPGSAMIGDGRGGVGHECVEWRQSAVGDKLHRGGLVVGDEPLPNAVGLVR